MTIWNFAKKKRTGLKTRRYKGAPEKNGEGVFSFTSLSLTSRDSRC
jgi:hypothetical protein